MKLRYVWLAVLAATSALSAQTDLNSLGNAALDRQDYSAAESYFRRAVDEYRAAGPAYEPHVAASLVNLAAAVCWQGRTAECAHDYEEALALHRRSLGPKHIRTLTNMNRLADTYLKLGDAERADALYCEALAVEREQYANDVQLAHSLAGLAALDLRQGNATDALPLAEEGLAVARRTAGEDGLEAARMYGAVGEIRRVLGQPDRALPLFRKARSLYEKTSGPDDPRIAPLLSKEALILMGEGKLTLADQALQGAFRVLDRSCPACVPERAVAENNLGLLRLKQKRYAEADRLLSHVLLLEEHYFPAPAPETAATRRNLLFARSKLTSTHANF